MRRGCEEDLACFLDDGGREMARCLQPAGPGGRGRENVCCCWEGGEGAAAGVGGGGAAVVNFGAR